MSERGLRARVLVGILTWSAAWLLACSGHRDDAVSDTTGGTASDTSGAPSSGVGGSGGASTATSSRSSGSSGGAPLAGGQGGRGGSSSRVSAAGGSVVRTSTVGTATGGSSTSSDGTERDDAVAFKDGTRQFENVLNVVDAAAAAQLEAFFDSVAGSPLELPANAFYEYYLDEYDFLFFVTSRPINSQVAGRFTAVNRPAMPGTGMDYIQNEPGYRSAGRLKGVMAIQFMTDFLMPALGHELAHYWANYLDPSLGFDPGPSGSSQWDPHWQFTGVNGVLGGFDPATLQCAKPEGAALSNCTPEANGRTRYRLGWFAPNDNTARVTAYAPLELYLMGLLPAEQVPQKFPVLRDAEELFDTFDTATETLLVEASTLEELSFADIVARHGKRALIPDAERAFKAAFMVVSSTPVADDVLERVALWQELFGNHVENQSQYSFETLTAGRATLSTRLGRRRAIGEPIAPPSVGLSCSYVKQDCSDGFGCYQIGVPRCAVAGSVQPGGTCGESRRCSLGYDCFFVAGSSEGTCLKYCDSSDSTSSKACQTLCPGTFQTMTTNGLAVGICVQ